jgi:hypothetical protein
LGEDGERDDALGDLLMAMLGQEVDLDTRLGWQSTVRCGERNWPAALVCMHPVSGSSRVKLSTVRALTLRVRVTGPPSVRRSFSHSSPVKLSVLTRGEMESELAWVVSL